MRSNLQFSKSDIYIEDEEEDFETIHPTARMDNKEDAHQNVFLPDSEGTLKLFAIQTEV